MSSSPTETKSTARLEKSTRLNDAGQFARSTATALTLLDDDVLARHGSLWQRRHNTGVFSVLGYHSKKPAGKGRHSLIPPDLLIVTHRNQLVLLLEMPATAEARIEVYYPGPWEVEFCQLIPTASQILDELRAMDHPAINAFLARVTPGLKKVEGN